MVGSAVTFLLARFIPLLGLVGIAGFAFLEIAIPAMAVRWWIKYRSIQTDYPDFARAKLTAFYVGGGGAVIFFLFVITGRVVIHAVGIEFHAN
jgi:hypothetical protein